jgi:hypothetical protein
VWRNTTDLSEEVIKYLEGRKISQGQYAGIILYPQDYPYFWQRSHDHAIQLLEGWRTCKHKFRDLEKHFMMVKDAELVFYNIDS